MSTATATPNLLELKGVHTHIGAYHILHGVDLTIPKGELTMLLGRNGAGKTTTLKTVAGVMPPTQGQVRFGGEATSRLATHQVAQRGICLVPEHRGIFKLLTVEENLLLAQRKKSPWQLADVYRIFPRLQERRTNGGGQLSGGEQQMLAIGRALMSKPRLLLLDEPTLGLAPLVIAQIFEIIQAIRAEGVTVFLVEQNANRALQIADRGYVLETGNLVLEDTGANLLSNDAVRRAYLGH